MERKEEEAVSFLVFGLNNGLSFLVILGMFLIVPTMLAFLGFMLGEVWPGFFGRDKTSCRRCGGSGVDGWLDNICPDCNGSG
ncbi:MAG: hypothetical protein A3F35_00665 [Candidatus Woykebacteria bacterium RIFCSPHIGHO2_12_FULL_45_10]|uniref:Uncharacterized protein n=1 Tax=Candidatus Woykebacteria bacterium RIFCSPHIGHO2_12_FULL_45_10 TaxID=1802603 RepID=A0A1G1WQY2_9BACT|nr:MAG: hypothetical protein A3F35_00665 [Candidatus Woykebacteria bacterium RIFCSPHIGHO2_12_FULL_45_10]